MKVIAFNGSPRPKGNTWHALNMVAAELDKAGISTEIVQVGNKVVRGCLACGKCYKMKNEQCVQTEDDVNQWIQLAKGADGILLGSPTHYAALSGPLKCFLDRLFYVAGANSGLLRHKVGAAVASVRRSGGIPVINQLNIDDGSASFGERGQAVRDNPDGRDDAKDGEQDLQPDG